MKQLFTVIVLILIGIGSCTKDASTWTGTSPQHSIVLGSKKPFELYTYKEYQPTFWTSMPSAQMPINFKNPAITDEKANVGRVLFYDKNLSISGKVACGSCHLQNKAFTDGLAFSKGHKDELTLVSSMSIQNMDFQHNYFWNSSEQNLKHLVTLPLLNSVEMGNASMYDVLKKVTAQSYYPDLFREAFGITGITESTIAEALSNFVQSIYSSDSKFDLGSKNNFQYFTTQEKAGLALFNGKAQCNHCHTAPTFAAFDFDGGAYGAANILSTPSGVFERKVDISNLGDGRTNNGLASANPILKNQIFRIPTLRNIAVTGPYMHDGRFRSLEEVIDHYDHGILFNESLDKVLMLKNSLTPKKLYLTPEDKASLLAFLHTLTDYTMLNAERYADPF